MLQGSKATNKANIVIFGSAWIAGVDYYEGNFDDEKQEEEEYTDDKDNDINDYEYDKMDENKLANIIQEPNNFQVPN